ncbi:MAG TPA: phosphate acyltransferase [Gemmatimonadales bacterium]|jgi:phosphate acetyltransferase|nr:phosphate acyltransferase [Gemmatimonadales bacterium]
MSLRDLLRARAAGKGARLVFPEGDDPRVIAAARQLADLGVAEPLLLTGANMDVRDSRVTRVASLLRERRPHAVRDGLHALDLAIDPLRFAAGLVALGEADGCVAGAVRTTADVIRAALWLIGTAPGVTEVTAAMYLDLPDGRVLTYTDISVIPQPTPAQLAAAALAAARDRTALVGDAPRVAFLSFSSKGSAAGADVDRVREALAIFQQLAPDVPADGELQADAALVPEVAARKAAGSSVAGRANVLVFPSLDAGNIAYKLTERLAGATAAGPLLQGLARPMSDLSRGASTDDIVDVAAMVALQARAGGV